MVPSSLRARVPFVLALAALGGSASAYVVDDFATGMSSSIILTNIGSDSRVTGFAGYSRTIESSIGAYGGTAGEERSLTAINGGSLNYSSDSMVNGTLEISYDFAPAFDGLVGTTGFQIDFRSNDQPMNVFVTLSKGGTDSIFYATAPAVTTWMGGSVLVPYTSGTGLLTSLSGIDRIKVSFDPTTAGDFRVEGIQAVPEPASLLALSAGACALLRRRRK